MRDLLDEGIEALAIVFLQSFTNDAHEQRAAEIARRVIRESGRNVPVVVSCEVAPTLREVSRANATVIQAYASEPARKQLVQVEEKLVAAGYAPLAQDGALLRRRHQHPLSAPLRDRDVGPRRRDDGRRATSRR